MHYFFSVYIYVYLYDLNYFCSVENFLMQIVYISLRGKMSASDVSEV